MSRVVCIGLASVVAIAPGLMGAPFASAKGAVGCAEPGVAWRTAAPDDVAVDAPALQDALDWATLHTSASVVVVRHGCLIGSSRLDAVTSAQAFDGWSMTKTVTALLVGRAVSLGLVDIDQPIRRLIPEASGRHGDLTMRHLLTMSSGLHVNWVRDLAPQPDRVRDALSLRFDYEPGTTWQYAQSPVTLLAHAIERAAGTDLQVWAQRELFGRLGIAADAWTWDRDRAGHTEGWAHLHMRAVDFARLGHLMLQDGLWNGQRLIAKRYLRDALTGTAVNPAYGFLVWLNNGERYVLPDVEGPDEGTGPLVVSAPRDMYLMAGSGEQRTFVIPSRGMVIVRLGDRGSREADTRTSVWTGRGGELDNELIRRVMLAVKDVPYEDPGPYAGSELYLPPPDRGVIGDAQDVPHVLAGVGAGPEAPAGCSPIGCDG
jgi:CubicO group peptidase (beta-lactamase class C family)